MVDDAREFTSTLIEEIFFDDNWDEFLMEQKQFPTKNYLALKKKFSLTML
jgi:hypothetical protein